MMVFPSLIYIHVHVYMYIGDDNAALLLHLQDNEGEIVGKFYKNVIKFYQELYFRSPVLRTLSFLDPV